MQERSLEVTKTLISFTAVKQTGGVRDRQHFSVLRGMLSRVIDIIGGSEGAKVEFQGDKVTPVLSETL